MLGRDAAQRLWDVLVAEPGDACGICLDGQYACDEDDTLVCSGASELNACGGCGELDGDPGFLCEDDAGDGVLLCRSETELVCVGGGENACGGAAALNPLPTQPCGVCNGGVTTCDGNDATTCGNTDRWLNACGGCSPLAGEPGESCGLCGGSYTCHPEDANRVVCDDPRNACGGCEVLDGIPGESCTEGDVWHCDGVDAAACGAETLNACGGEQVLDASPGVACGPCGDGVQICASPEVMACVDAYQRNVCGGCSLLPGVPGLPCGAGHTWQCAGGDLSCLRGEGQTTGQVGDSCTDLLECDTGLCLIVDSEAEEGFCSLACQDDFDCPDGFDCEVLAVETSDAPLKVCLPGSLCFDPDTDGYGVGPACLGVDCDESDLNINEDAVDVCDGDDNDCDGVINGNNGNCGDPRWVQCLGEGRRASCQEVDGCAPDDDGMNYCGDAQYWHRESRPTIVSTP